MVNLHLGLISYATVLYYANMLRIVRLTNSSLKGKTRAETLFPCICDNFEVEDPTHCIIRCPACEAKLEVLFRELRDILDGMGIYFLN